MKNKDSVLWGIHAGKTGDADTLFKTRKCIAIGWKEMGDLRKLEPNRDSFKQKIAQIYPYKKPGSVPTNAGQLFRFIHEMKKGDFVAYPSKADRMIYIGRVEGDYDFNTESEESYPHRRQVSWIQSFPRTKFTQGALHEIGSAMSLFQIKDYSDEFLDALEGKGKAEENFEDDTIGMVSGEIEESTRDFVLKRLSQELKGHPFAQFIAHLLEQMGYQTRVAMEGPDGGIDIIAHKDELGFEPPIIKVQVKSGSGTISGPDIAALIGNLGSGEYGLFVTLGTFSKDAKSKGRSKSNIRLIDGNELVDLILEHYEELDSKYKGLMPLKRVFVPEVFEEE